MAVRPGTLSPEWIVSSIGKAAGAEVNDDSKVG